MHGRSSGAALLVLAAVTLAGCPAEPRPAPTGSVCPSDSTLTYDNFGRAFMESYCTRCHSSELRRADRNGAPLYHDLNTLTDILAVADHVDEYTAAGPDAVNELMPPDGDMPTRAERFQLGEWLTCELEKINAPASTSAGADAGS